MKVKIVKCSDDNYWYKNHVGKFHEVEHSDVFPDDYQLINHSYRLFLKSDCEIIEDSKPINNKSDYDYINPNHYKSQSIETIDMMLSIWGKEDVAKHCEMCAFKYRMRIGSKPDQPIDRDIEKAKWYENKAKELLTTKKEDIMNE